MNKNFFKWCIFILVNIFFSISLCYAYNNSNLTEKDFIKINQRIQDTFFLKKRLQRDVQKKIEPYLKCGTSLMRLAKRFPEMEGIRPSVKRHPKSTNGNPQYLLTYKGKAAIPGGRKINRIVRVTATDRGKIVRMSTSK